MLKSLAIKTCKVVKKQKDTYNIQLFNASYNKLKKTYRARALGQGLSPKQLYPLRFQSYTSKRNSNKNLAEVPESRSGLACSYLSGNRSDSSS